MHHGKHCFPFLLVAFLSEDQKIPLTIKIRPYDATCVSRMLYNCNSWATPKTFLDKLDACHKKHLRTITNHRWPHSVISNDALYKMCYECQRPHLLNRHWSLHYSDPTSTYLGQADTAQIFSVCCKLT